MAARHRHGWLVLLALLGLSPSVVPYARPDAAAAGTYRVAACGASPGGSNGAWMLVTSDPAHLAGAPACVPGLGVQDALGSGTAALDARAEWVFRAPPGTRITSLQAARFLGAQDGTAWRAYLRDGAGTIIETCTPAVPATGCLLQGPVSAGTSGPLTGTVNGVTYAGLDTDALALGVVCASAAGCPAGSVRPQAWVRLAGATVTLSDPTAPAVAPLTGLPAANAAGWSHGQVTVSATAADAESGVAQLALWRNGVRIATADQACDSTRPAPCAATASATFADVVPGDGTFTLVLRATDATQQQPGASSAATTPVSVRIDDTPPSGTLGLAAGAVLRGSAQLTARGVADATSGVRSVGYEVAPAGSGAWDTLGLGPVASAAPHAARLDTTAYADGLYDIRLTVADRADNVTVRELDEVRIDNTRPTAALAPLPAELTSGAVLDAGAVADDGAGVASVRFEWRPAGGAAWAPLATATAPPYRSTLAGLADGRYELRAVVADRGGLTSTTAAQSVQVDATPPSVVLAAPGVVLGGAAAGIRATAADAGTGVASVVLELAPQSPAGAWMTLVECAASPCATSVDTALLPDGEYLVRAHALDAVGNSRTTTATLRVGAPAVASSRAPGSGTASGSDSGRARQPAEVAPPPTRSAVRTPGAAVTTADARSAGVSAPASAPAAPAGADTASGRPAPLRLRLTAQRSRAGVLRVRGLTPSPVAIEVRVAGRVVRRVPVVDGRFSFTLRGVRAAVLVQPAASGHAERRTRLRG